MRRVFAIGNRTGCQHRHCSLCTNLWSKVAQPGTCPQDRPPGAACPLCAAAAAALRAQCWQRCKSLPGKEKIRLSTNFANPYYYYYSNREYIEDNLPPPCSGMHRGFLASKAICTGTGSGGETSASFVWPARWTRRTLEIRLKNRNAAFSGSTAEGHGRFQGQRRPATAPTAHNPVDRTGTTRHLSTEKGPGARLSPLAAHRAQGAPHTHCSHATESCATEKGSCPQKGATPTMTTMYS